MILEHVRQVAAQFGDKKHGIGMVNRCPSEHGRILPFIPHTATPIYIVVIRKFFAKIDFRPRHAAIDEAFPYGRYIPVPSIRICYVEHGMSSIAPDIRISSTQRHIRDLNRIWSLYDSIFVSHIDMHFVLFLDQGQKKIS